MSFDNIFFSIIDIMSFDVGYTHWIRFRSECGRSLVCLLVLHGHGHL